MSAQPVPTCVGCGREATRYSGGRPFCESRSCHQVPGTRNKDQDQVGTEGVRRLYVVPGAPGGDQEREPEMRGLIRDWEHGRLRPVHVELGPLPAPGSRTEAFDGRRIVVTETMHDVAADIRLLLSLRLAVDEERPLPCWARFCAERCRLRDHRQASRALRALEQIGVIRCAGTLKPRGKPDGMKTYEAP